MIPVEGGVVQAAALAFCALLAGLAVFQAALIAGAPLGHLAWGGRDRVLPRGKRIGSVVSIALYLVFALIVLSRAELVTTFPGAFAAVAAWVLVAYFLLGVALNAASNSRPERRTMVPLSLALTVLTLVVALGG
jgi:hypothetical protein